MRIKHKQIQAGDVFKTKEGGSVTVVEYIDSRNVLIQHNDSFKHQTTVESCQLRDGRVKNPYLPSIHGVGYYGVGSYVAWKNGKHTKAYRTWSNMLARCYCDEYKLKNTTYVDCVASGEWHNFQVFAEWFYDQPHSKMTGFDLDKDLLVLGNKVYSASTCSFVPNQINKLLLGCDDTQGHLPVGVRLNNRKYQAQLSVAGKRLALGTYATPDEAAAVYVAAKKQHVIFMAERWREWLHPLVYANLKEWSL